MEILKDMNTVLMTIFFLSGIFFMGWSLYMESQARKRLAKHKKDLEGLLERQVIFTMEDSDPKDSSELDDLVNKIH